MMNAIWFALVIASVIAAAFTGTMEAVSTASVESAKNAVTLALGLIGVMAFWLGMMRILQEGGLLHTLARGMRPIMTRLFPEVPADHPAMSAMIMNLASNMIGLGNAATPFGIKAMMELNRLNRVPGVATNAMVLFLAINTSNVALAPLGVIALRASIGSHNAAGIWVPTLLATTFSTIVAIIATKMLERVYPPVTAYENECERGSDRDVRRTSGSPGGSPSRADAGEPSGSAAETEAAAPASSTSTATDEAIALGAGRVTSQGGCAFAILALVAIGVGFGLWAARGIQDGSSVGDIVQQAGSSWVLPVLIAVILLYGYARQVPLYDAMIAGAQEGFQVAVRIIPFLVAIVVAAGMFRASGLLDLLVRAVGPLTGAVGFPPEALPMALLRPLSGSGAYAIMAETMQAYGPDSYIGYLVSVLQGSTETTFYVLAVYFGAVGVVQVRHGLAAGIIADLAGVVGATAAVAWLMG